MQNNVFQMACQHGHMDKEVVAKLSPDELTNLFCQACVHGHLTLAQTLQTTYSDKFADKVNFTTLFREVYFCHGGNEHNGATFAKDMLLWLLSIHPNLGELKQTYHTMVSTDIRAHLELYSAVMTQTPLNASHKAETPLNASRKAGELQFA